MSNTVFNARFTPTNSSMLSADTFQVIGAIFDGTGVYSGLDVSLNDVVFLDTFNSVTAPSTVSRYTIQSILFTSVSEAEVVLKYADTGTPVDPSEVIGNPGFICLASFALGLGYVSAPSLHTFPDYVAQYARNYDSYIKLESALSNVDSSVVKGLYLNNSGSTIPFTLVRQDNLGNIHKIDPSIESDAVNYLGVLLGSTPNGSSGLVALSGLVKNISTGFSMGDIVYLSKTGGLTIVVPEIGTGGFVAGDFVIKVGKITKNSTIGTQKDFKVEVELKGQI